MKVARSLINAFNFLYPFLFFSSSRVDLVFDSNLVLCSTTHKMTRVEYFESSGGRICISSSMTVWVWQILYWYLVQVFCFHMSLHSCRDPILRIWTFALLVYISFCLWWWWSSTWTWYEIIKLKSRRPNETCGSMTLRFVLPKEKNLLYVPTLYRFH